MALITSQQYLDSMKKLNPRVYIGGKWVKNLLENPVTKSMVMANSMIYELAEQPENKEVMVATSHLTGEPVNRNLNVARNIHDLDMLQEMALLTSQAVGTCNYRCVGCDALNSVAATTWEMDRDLGTKYNERFNKWLASAQKNDLAVSGVITDAKGDRKKRPTQQEEKDVFAFAGEDVKVHRRAFVSLEVGYLWADAELGQDFEGFEPVDLSGLQTSLGIVLVF